MNNPTLTQWQPGEAVRTDAFGTPHVGRVLHVVPGRYRRVTDGELAQLVVADWKVGTTAADLTANTPVMQSGVDEAVVTRLPVEPRQAEPARKAAPLSKRTAKKRGDALRKQIDKQVEQIFYRRCSGLQINILDIGKVFTAGRDAALTGGDVEAAVVAAAEALRQN